MRDATSSGFRGQLLCQKAQAFALALITVVRELPNDRSADSIGRQLIRSGSSIAANIAEGYGRYSQGAYRNHLSIARGSAFESESWIDLLVESGYVGKEAGDDLLSQCMEIQKLLTYRMKTLDQHATRRSREEQAPYDLV